ncbi:MAG: DNA replication and repair protein RecF [Candidatus Sumerlaeia bacterium]|nr:DNA replication and repair protein RecF [Candidatus Sumerlaeia bacterium]
MRLHSLAISQFRLIRQMELQLPPGLTVFLGANAQGKTSILEAVSFLSTGRSFRTTREKEVIPFESSIHVARAVGQFTRAQVNHEISVAIESAGKRILLDDKPARSLSQVLGQMTSVFFSPGDLELVQGAPALRRDFLRLLLAQLDPGSLKLMTTYDRALKDRNALLRWPSPPRASELDAFEAIMARAAAALYEQFGTLAERLRDAARPFHEQLAAGEELGAALESALPPALGAARPTEQELRALWESQRGPDRQRGTTLHGPHRDDLALTINGEDARKFASQGQARSLALSLRLGQLALLEERWGEPPVLLLDDIVGELDRERTERFLRIVARTGAQALLAATDAAALNAAGAPVSRLFRIHQGGVLR